MEQVYTKIMSQYRPRTNKSNNVKKLGSYNGMPARKLGMYNNQPKKVLGMYN